MTEEELKREIISELLVRLDFGAATMKLFKEMVTVDDEHSNLKKEEFLDRLFKIFRAEEIEAIAAESYIEIYDLEDLKSLRDFYGTESGMKIYKKSLEFNTNLAWKINNFYTKLIEKNIDFLMGE